MDYITTRKQIEAMLIKKATEDDEFRKLLFADPSEALKKIGIDIPNEFRLKVIPESRDELILVFPAASVKDELSELELIHASGGSPANSGGGAAPNG